jgi:hypothetical protein
MGPHRHPHQIEIATTLCQPQEIGTEAFVQTDIIEKEHIFKQTIYGNQIRNSQALRTWSSHVRSRLRHARAANLEPPFS